GGLFITKTACIGHMNPLLRIALPVMRVLGLAPRVNFLTVDRLEAAIRDNGFEIVETGLYPAKSHSRFVVARKNRD
ncbi:MAG: class I SAM-dependent methyltransferase, partial [Notoacmeibacter sp.]|nr:class I SAM-dependent methyltransferase [Notoacmeibacter sp.]